jgi:hypothetical protein
MFLLESTPFRPRSADNGNRQRRGGVLKTVFTATRCGNLPYGNARVNPDDCLDETLRWAHGQNQNKRAYWRELSRGPWPQSKATRCSGGCLRRVKVERTSILTIFFPFLN